MGAVERPEWLQRITRLSTVEQRCARSKPVETQPTSRGRGRSVEDGWWGDGGPRGRGTRPGCAMVAGGGRWGPDLSAKCPSLPGDVRYAGNAALCALLLAPGAEMGFFGNTEPISACQKSPIFISSSSVRQSLSFPTSGRAQEALLGRHLLRSWWGFCLSEY